jgi:tRNA A-37 threonylcarbamoyl transferase component Bud32
LREKFFYQVFNHGDFLPEILEPVSTTSSDRLRNDCANQLLVLESVGEYNLADWGLKVLRAGGQAGDVSPAAMLIDIAISSIEIIRTIHDYGFVHGKIFASNWIYHDPTNVAGSLSLIDYSRAAPYMSIVRRNHAVEGDKVRVMDFVLPENVCGRSIFELENLHAHVLSRRDDWYMLSEMFLSLLSSDCPETRLHASSGTAPTGRIHLPSLITDRRNREYSGAPAIFLDMFEYTKTLEYTDRPDYEYWIRRLVYLKSILKDFSTPLSPSPIDIFGETCHLIGVEFDYVSDYYNRVDDWIAKRLTCDCKSCPPKKFFVAERGGDVPFELYGGALAQCVRSAVRRVVATPSGTGNDKAVGQSGPTTGDQSKKWEGVIVKVPRKYWKEKIVAELYTDSAVTPAVYTPVGVESACAACMLIMETAGAVDLEEYRMQRPSISITAAISVAIRLITVVRKFHSRGFVHGDIHLGNFSFKNGFFDSLKVIDFDRSVPFIDPISRRHVRPR